MRNKLAVFSLVLCLITGVASAQADKPIAPPTVTDTYAAKYICGVMPDQGLNAVPDAEPGRYASKINVHNNTGILIRFRKKFIRLRGGEVPIAPHDVKLFEELKPDWAMEVVCADVYKHYNITGQPPPYMEGFVVLEVYYQNPPPPSVPVDPLDVVGVYTYTGNVPPPASGPAANTGASIEVVPYPAKRNRHLMVP